MFGDDKLAMLAGVTVGEDVEVHFNLSSREFNGKYYHNIDAWKIDKATGAGGNAPEPFNSAPAPMPAGSDGPDDLPF